MFDDLLSSHPYARFLGASATISENHLQVVMPFADHLIGDPFLPALHGGSTAALLELTATAQVAHSHPGARPARPIDVTISYLRSGRPEPVLCEARILRAGRRVVHVTAEAWQGDRAAPIATLSANFLLDDL